MQDLRKQYTMAGLVDQDMLACPFEQLRKWFQIALDSVPVDFLEANAMTLATASATGEVTARIVLLKGIDDRGLLFYTNYESPKGRQLAENPRAAVVFYWPHLERQVRVEGTVERVSRELSDEYFHSRPRGSQIGAAVSDQSAVLSSREELEAKAAAFAAELADAEVPLPDAWGGYRLLPTVFEFWQGRANRLHDRFCYRATNEGWQRSRLAP